MAERILQRYGSMPADKITDKQSASIDWARNILKAHPPTNPAVKRQRSQEEVTKEVKRPRPNQPTPKSYSEIAKTSLVLGVIDRNAEEGRIPRDKWKWVSAALSSVFLQVLEEHPGPLPSCEDAGWHRGLVKLIACADERSATLYKVAISKVGEVWPGAKLEAVDKKDIPSPPRARVRIPATPSDPDQILKMFRVCNPTLPVHDWKIAKLEETDGPTRLALLVLSAESLKPLAGADYIVSYGFEKVTVRVYRTEVGEAAVGAVAAGGEPLLEPVKDSGSRCRTLSAPSSVTEPVNIADAVAASALNAAELAGVDPSLEFVTVPNSRTRTFSAASSIGSLTRLFDEEDLLKSSEDEEADCDADATMVGETSEHESAADKPPQI